MGESVEFETKPAFALPVGATIGGYSIRRLIGKGGFGITYEAFNRITGKEVAIKEFFPTGIAWRDGQSHLSYSRADSETIDWALRKFEDTTTTLCRLEHPNIVQVHDYVPYNDTGYMIMELLDGQTLQQWLEARARPPGLDELRPLMDPVMEALSYVHGKGLVHRDIAPDNILITQSGRPVLIDFGSVSRDLTLARAANQSGTKGVWKRHYTAPEQIMANAWPTPQADIYSMGAVLYRALAGVEPVDGDARKHEGFLGGADPYRPLADRRPDGLPAKAAEAIDKALALRAENRFHSITEFRAGLDRREPPRPPEDRVVPPVTQHEQQVSQLPPVTSPPSMAKWLVAGAVVVVLALIGGVLGGKAISDRNGQFQRAQDDLQRQRDEAERQVDVAKQRQAEADRRAGEYQQATDAARRREAEASQREAEAQRQRDDARAQADAQQAEASRQAEAERQAEAQRQADAQRRADTARPPSLQQLAANAAATFYNRHSFTPGDDLSALVSLYPASAPIVVNGTQRTGSGQVAELQRFFQKGRYTSFQIAIVPGTLAFDCDFAERCIVKGQTRASYQTEDNPTPRSSLANFCLRLDLRGSPKVLSESAVKTSKEPSCG